MNNRRSKNWKFVSSREDSTRLAMLLRGEAHVVDLLRELQGEALKKGMKVYSASQLPSEWVWVFIQQLIPHSRGSKVQSRCAVEQQEVRQAMNIRAVNRHGATRIAYSKTRAHSSTSVGLHPIWRAGTQSGPSASTQLYGYNPTMAKELLKAAGYGPGSMKLKILAFTEPGRVGGPAGGRSRWASTSRTWASSRDRGASTGPRLREHVQSKKLSSAASGPISSRGGPSEEWIRDQPTTARVQGHHFEDEFIDKHYLTL